MNGGTWIDKWTNGTEQGVWNQTHTYMGITGKAVGNCAPFNQWCTIRSFIWEKTVLTPTSHIIKNQFQVILNLDVKYKTVTLLKNNIEEYFHDPRIGKDFFKQDTKSTIHKGKYWNIGNFCYQKTPLWEWKGKPWNGGTYLYYIYIIKIPYSLMRKSQKT